MTQAEQWEKITTQYLPAFFGYALNKTGSIMEAEELAQEIAAQAVKAVCSRTVVQNFDRYIWGIAHNTYKRWCAGCCNQPLSLDTNADTLSNIVGEDMPVIEQIVQHEERDAIRLALSRLTHNYRRILVCFYFDELPICEIGKRLALSDGMVKFFLRAGKQKLREAMDMNTIGEKSFRPSPFSIYKSSIEFSKVDVWAVFKRILPCQMAIVCHDSDKTISDISVETGTPAIYIEDEMRLLLEAGVMISPVKGKYRTNFHILLEAAVAQIKGQFTKLFAVYAPLVMQAYNKYLPALKRCGIFKFDAAPAQWRWYFTHHIPEFDYTGHNLTAEDYPSILSCGSKAIIFAQAAEGPIWAVGATPTFLEKGTVYPCDVAAFGAYHRQKELWDKNKAQALYDVYCQTLHDEDKVYYAELIQQGYVIKAPENTLLCNVAVTTEKSRQLFGTIHEELSAELGNLCRPIRENISRIVRATLPEQLKAYTKGYTETWISFYAGVCLKEVLFERGFLSIPEKDDLTPVACWISEH